MVNIPTLLQLYNGIIADYQTQFGITINPVGKTFLRAKAGVQAAKIKLVYLALANIQKNIWVDTADPESSGGTLERIGRVKLNRNPFPAVAAQYNVQLNGQAGAIIQASTSFKTDDTSLNAGMLFILDNTYTMLSTNDVITLRALTSGTQSKLNALDTLTATSPIPFVNSSVYVVPFQITPTYKLAVVEPEDAEDIEVYRSNIIRSFRLSPQGGSAVDYILWSEDAQGVVATYPYAAPFNEVNVFVESSLSDSTDNKGTPTSTMLNDVASVIELNPDITLPILERGRRPLGTWQVNCLPVSIITVDISIIGMQGRTTQSDAEVLSAIVTYLKTVRPFVAAADILSDKNDTITAFSFGGIIAAAVPGNIFTNVTFTITPPMGSPTAYAVYQFINGNIPYADVTNIHYS